VELTLDCANSAIVWPTPPLVRSIDTFKKGTPSFPTSSGKGLLDVSLSQKTIGQNEKTPHNATSAKLLILNLYCQAI
jgi:hypothetical protein